MITVSSITSRSSFEAVFPHIDASEIENNVNPKMWTHKSSYQDRSVGPSSLFLELLTRMNTCWVRNKESTVRTYIDQVIVDVLWGRRKILRDVKKTRNHQHFG